jgi:hypothetical protein
MLGEEIVLASGVMRSPAGREGGNETAKLARIVRHSSGEVRGAMPRRKLSHHITSAAFANLIHTAESHSCF